ncbi:DUF4184 family protein [Microbacterium sp. SD291]|uniref:DUF4184 family protein n=1 Tax=Microbacterium sp. SD291 TaxID=2782007 RepID=UPI001A96B365|nr:DUF4184 family protein [Microbacterium sp. SD291]MBO0981406.1 DUF4184 family protein [Microbacterium sp. SD291]
MPFTPSHALIALPFVRTPLVPAAIAIGAMTPDLPLFVRGAGVDYSFTHTYANIAWTALLAFGLFLVWRVVLRPAALELAPLRLARRLPADWATSGLAALRRAVGIGAGPIFPLLLAVSLLLGVVSHIVWDSFTHEGRWGVEVLPALDSMWGPLTGFKWLQHGSSIGGLAIIGVWAVVRLAGTSPRSDVTRALPAGIRIAWWVSLPVILLTAWAVGLAAYGPFTDGFTPQHLGYRVLPPACAVWGALTLGLCLVLPPFRHRHQRG